MIQKLSLFLLMVATIGLSGCAVPFVNTDASKVQMVQLEPVVEEQKVSVIQQAIDAQKPIDPVVYEQLAKAAQQEARKVVASGDPETIAKSFITKFHSVNYADLLNGTQKEFNGMDYTTTSFAKNLSGSSPKYRVYMISNKEVRVVRDVKLTSKVGTASPMILKFAVLLDRNSQNIVQPQETFTSTITLTKVDGKWLVDGESKS